VLVVVCLVLSVMVVMVAQHCLELSVSMVVGVARTTLPVRILGGRLLVAGMVVVSAELTVRDWGVILR
jgi:hypothetical protein